MNEFSTETGKAYKAILESLERSRMLTSSSTINKMNCEVTNHLVEQFTKYDTIYIRTVLTFADGSKAVSYTHLTLPTNSRV